MWPLNFSGCPSPFGTTASSHNPFRLVQSGRTIWGRGYSGNTLSTETCEVQGVVRVLAAGFQSCAQSGVRTPATAVRESARIHVRRTLAIKKICIIAGFISCNVRCSSLSGSYHLWPAPVWQRFKPRSDIESRTKWRRFKRCCPSTQSSSHSNAKPPWRRKHYREEAAGCLGGIITLKCRMVVRYAFHLRQHLLRLMAGSTHVQPTFHHRELCRRNTTGESQVRRMRTDDRAGRVALNHHPTRTPTGFRE